MDNYINYSEMHAAGDGFDLQSIYKSEKNGLVTTTVYSGYAPEKAPTLATRANNAWVIRRTVIVEDSTQKEVETTWAKGSWNDRVSLSYKYGKP